jgi:hypothetical protein
MNWQQLKQEQLKQFTAEELAENRELLEMIQGIRRKPVKRKPKAKIQPVSKWVITRYLSAHENWHKQAYKVLHADGHQYIPPKKIPDFTKTNDISNGIRDWIKWHGGQADQYNVQGRLIQTPQMTTITGQVIEGKSVMIKSSATKGATDVTGTYKGRSLKIEVKNKYTKDMIKPEQDKYKQSALKAGALHLYAYDMETFILWWDNVVSNQPDLELF